MIADRKVLLKVPKGSQAQVCKKRVRRIGRSSSCHSQNKFIIANSRIEHSFTWLYPSLGRSISKET